MPAPTTIRLDDNTRARVRRLATVRQRTPHWVMKEAISAYLDREEAEEGFRQEGKGDRDV